MSQITEVLYVMKKLSIFPIILVLILMMFIWGCDSVTTSDSTGQYYLIGGLVKNLDLDLAQTVVYMEKNDSLFDDATIVFDNDTLIYNGVDELYWSENTASGVSQGSNILRVSDSPNLSELLSYTVPGDFQITSIQLPEDRTNNGGDPVPIIWSLSLGSDGYFYSVNLKDSAYTTAGFSEFVTTGTASTTIPRDAFQLYSDLDTGWYYVYVCSYDGSPASDYNLPTAIPPGLTENISKIRLSGQFGTIVVTPRDSIHVTLQ